MILDTNALSAAADGEPAVVAQMAIERRLAIPVIVLGEYRFGIVQSSKRPDYEQWLDQMLAVCDVLDIGQETSACYAELRLELKRAGTPIPSNDLWIAALCRQHSLPLLSSDGHFDSVRGIRRLGW